MMNDDITPPLPSFFDKNGKVKLGTWKDDKNHKIYADWLGKKLGYTKLEDWYGITKLDISNNFGNGIFTRYYKSSPSRFVMSIYKDEHDWLPWKFIRSPMGYWKKTENVKSYLDWLCEEIGYTNMEDLYNLRYDVIHNNYGGYLLDTYHNSSPYQLVMTTYKDVHDWVPWKFKSISNGYWDEEKHRIKYAKWLYKELGYTNLEDLYRIKQKTIIENGGSGLLQLHYNGSPFQFINSCFPDYKWIPWKFDGQVPKGYWQDKNNHIKYIEWLGKELGYTKMEDWYKNTTDIIYKNGGVSLLALYYNHSHSQLLMSVYRDYNWLPWKFNGHVPAGYWDKKEHRVKYVKWLYKELGYTKLEDWYKLTHHIIINNYGGGLMQVYYDTSILKLLLETYPNYHWIESKIQKQYSTGEIEWVEFLKITIPDIRHVLNHNDGQYKPLSGSNYKADGFSEDNMHIFEYDGDFHHGNPDIYPPHEINPLSKKTFGELYKATLEKQKRCEDAGYKYSSIWESEWKRGKKALIKIQRIYRNRHIST